MAKIISVNAGSSSLKFQLFEMDDESVITSGVIERIGLEDSIFTIKYQGKKTVTTNPIKDHKVAVQLLLDTLIEKGIVKELNEIKGVGHRVVQGGSYFDSSAIIDEDVVSKIDELKSLAPLHNPAHLTGYYAFKEAIPEAGWTITAHTFDLHHDPVMCAGNVMTEYEEKFSSMGNPICKLIAMREPKENKEK